MIWRREEERSSLPDRRRSRQHPSPTGEIFQGIPPQQEDIETAPLPNRRAEDDKRDQKKIIQRRSKKIVKQKI